jgi:AGZA family xanthine/uracil permease-like MFS transporter
MKQLLERLFRLQENGTSVGTEIRGGVATYLTMSYIIKRNNIALRSTYEE